MSQQGESREEEQDYAGSTATGWLAADGSLPRRRADDGHIAWSKVATGPEAGQQLLAELAPREVALLRELAARRYLTLEQIARRFYNSQRTALRYMGNLFRRRAVCRLVPTPPWLARAVTPGGRPPQVYFLDWNGKYALEAPAPGEERRGGRPGRLPWDPRTIAAPGPSSAHLLGLNEVWSHLLTAARHSSVPLAVGWRGEGPAIVRYADGKGKQWALRPDAELWLRIGRPDSPGPAATDLARPGADSQAGDWEGVDLPRHEQPDAGALGGLQVSEERGGPRYRLVLLEFESGAHHHGALIGKVEQYNRLIAREDVWKERYGPRFPRLLLVVRQRKYLAGAAAIWREHYLIRPRPGSVTCPVLMTSVEDLAAAEQHGPAGVLGRCWLHAMDPDGGDLRWLTLGEALGAGGL